MQTFVNTWCLFHLFELNLFRPLKPNTVKLFDSFCTQGVSLLQIASVPLRNMASVVFSLVFNQLTVPRIPFTSFLVPLEAKSVKLLAGRAPRSGCPFVDCSPNHPMRIVCPPKTQRFVPSWNIAVAMLGLVLRQLAYALVRPMFRHDYRPTQSQSGQVSGRVPRIACRPFS